MPDPIVLPITDEERAALEDLGRQTGLTNLENVLRVALFRMAKDLGLHPQHHLFQVRVREDGSRAS